MRIFEGKLAESSKLADLASSLLFSLVSHLPLLSNVSFAKWIFSWDSLVFPWVYFPCIFPF